MAYPTTQEVHEILTAEFGEAIKALCVPDAEKKEGGDAWIEIDAARVHDVCAFLRDDARMRYHSLHCVSGVDWDDRIEIVYHLYPNRVGEKREPGGLIVVKAAVPREGGKLPTVSDLWSTANWLERETYDMFGVEFENHPDLRRILLPQDWQGWPLLKDYKVQEMYHDIPVPYDESADADKGVDIHEPYPDMRKSRID